MAKRYDLFNRLSSLGLDRVWRRELAGAVRGAGRVLDVGCGTGETTRLLGAWSVGTDVSLGMLESAKPRGGAVAWVGGRADQLPFRDGSLQAVVSAFVMRNLHVAGVLEGSLRECFRVLAPGGRLAFLDLTRPGSPILRWGHRLYGRTVVPAIGWALFRGRWPGSYLADSIESLPDEQAVARLCRTAGARSVSVRRLTGGIVSLFLAEK